MKILLTATVFLLMSAFLKAAEPVVQLEPLPPDNQLEKYEDSEELFAIKLLEYYQKALILQTQLELMGLKPEVRPVQPTLEELQDPRDVTDALKDYFYITARLYNQVKKAPGTQLMQNEKVIQDTILYYENKIWELKKEFIEEKVDLIAEKDSTCTNKLEKMENFYNDASKDYVKVISIDVSENLFISSASDRITNQPSLAARISLNAYKIFGFWHGLDFWYEYYFPRIETRTFIPTPLVDSPEWKWNIDVHSLGAATMISPLVKTEHYSDGLRLALGYFWADGDVYKRDFTRVNWKGARFDIAYFAGEFDQRIPLEIFFGLSFFHSFSEDLLFAVAVPGHENINSGRTQISLNLGLRYNFWRSPF